MAVARRKFDDQLNFHCVLLNVRVKCPGVGAMNPMNGDKALYFHIVCSQQDLESGTQMPDCVFCKVISKQTNTKFVYEDEEVVVFLDVNPIAEGHSLVVPKRHFVDLTDVNPKILGKTTQIAQRLSQKMQSELGADGVNLFVASGEAAEQTVFHFHLHVIPRKTDDHPKLAEWWKPKIRKATSDELTSLTKRLRIQ
jgi:histidine triad (HIT) family protein